MPKPPDTETAEIESQVSDETIDSWEAVGLTAHKLNPENEKGLSNADQAALRRIDPDTPVTPTLWKVLFDLDQDESPDWIGQTKWERRWATLLMGMAHCAGLHDYDVPFGQALAEAGWSETRFVRLMEADEDVLPVLIRRMAQYLASKQQAANWDDVRQLLFVQSGDAAEDVRLRIARPYYRTLHAEEEI
ncbi:type I-E CRISPR-associated protein Cse2/CasB [Salinibacter altiplanensis]|uniref:type I-E CRISPR-associated protein Cse2/CasB n=1 Tax=Salinibacter altiplanensis TaxID=1803181 RepID=UPI000C9ED671|nr:type I-E CRISPR-associated protein Cse2/CasB [Salinibacter altiplanensis]